RYLDWASPTRRVHSDDHARGRVLFVASTGQQGVGNGVVDTLKAGDLTCPISLPHLPTRPSVQARSRLPKLGSLAASASVTTPKLAPSLRCRMRLSRFS